MSTMEYQSDLNQLINMTLDEDSDDDLDDILNMKLSEDDAMIDILQFSDDDTLIEVVKINFDDDSIDEWLDEWLENFDDDSTDEWLDQPFDEILDMKITPFKYTYKYRNTRTNIKHTPFKSTIQATPRNLITDFNSIENNDQSETANGTDDKTSDTDVEENFSDSDYLKYLLDKYT